MRLSIYQSVVFFIYFGALFVVFPSHTGASGAEDELVVHLNTGSVRGGSQKSIFGLNLECFLGIPYATAPVGDLRFSPPQPAQPWKGVRDGTNYGARCPQNEDSFPRNITVGMFNVFWGPSTERRRNSRSLPKTRAFRKRSTNRRNLKTPVTFWCGRKKFWKRSFSETMIIMRVFLEQIQNGWWREFCVFKFLRCSVDGKHLMRFHPCFSEWKYHFRISSV